MLAGPAGAQGIEPLGIGMEGFRYPHPVQWLDLRMEGEPVRMAYMDVRPESAATGRTVVLWHGRNFFGGYWQHTIGALTAAGYRVVVPDQIGFGKSSKPDVPHSLHLHAQNTRQLLDALGVRKADLIAHSLGGMMAVRFALMYPDRVNRLVLESPIGLEDYRLKVPYATREELAQEHAATAREGFERLFRAFFAHWRPEYEVYIDVQHRWQLGPEARWIARTAAHTYQMAYEQPVVYELHLVSAPTLIVAGERDRAAIGRNRVSAEVRATLGLYTELAPRAVRALPNGELLMLPGVGHVAHLEAPERFHSEVLRFLQR
jgi:pimeloyl-ACP methyl ester carboxylesterase